MTPTPDEREELAASIRDDPFLKLDGFTRDVYKTMLVSVSSETSKSGLIARARKVGYEVSDGPDGQGLILEAPEGASEKVSMGGNRLMYPPSDRNHTWPDAPIKSASRQVVIGPNDEPTSPRYECSCGARYYGEAARDTCLGQHLIDSEVWSR